MFHFRNDLAQTRYDQIVQFAQDNDCMTELQPQLDTLERFANADHHRCTLAPDWADYSLSFVIEHKNGDGVWQGDFNGGLIYHGPAMTQDPLSIELCPQPGHHWSIHT